MTDWQDPKSSDSGKDCRPKPISRIVEADLVDRDGELLGVVDELLIDLSSGRIEYVLAAGRSGQRMRFPWSSISVQDGSFVLHRAGPHLVAGR